MTKLKLLTTVFSVALFSCGSAWGEGSSCSEATEACKVIDQDGKEVSIIMKKGMCDEINKNSRPYIIRDTETMKEKE
ncbi:MAG: hypothetical protein P8P83_02255 [Rickettsiaceae bacterium]|nr:hypothetical protein [Rickettsiaceae bacterium]